MALRFSTKLANDALGVTGLAQALADGVIYIYSGTQPADPDLGATGTLLGIVTQDAAAWAAGAATNGLEFGTPAARSIAKASAENWKFLGLADGVAGWFRQVGNATDDPTTNSAILPRLDGSIGKTSGDLRLNNIDIVTSAPHTVDTYQIDLFNKA